jgi:tetratricopeptide (TPR) repeat protein
MPEARDLFKQALAIRDRTPERTQHILAMNLYSLAAISAGLEDSEQAELYFSRALEIDQAVFGQDDPFVALQIEKGKEYLAELNEESRQP